MIIEMVKRGIPMPCILFANTGGEKPPTIAYLETFSDWLEQHGYPRVTEVRYKGNHGRYSTLQGACEANAVLPSLAYGGKSCSLKFKAEIQELFLQGRSRGPNKAPGFEPALEAWKNGLKVVRAIGYDAGVKDARREGKSEDDRYVYVYPLREFGMDRLACMESILAEKLPLPIKSSCYFCPASKQGELIWLHAHYPELFMHALLLEEIARPRLTTIEGLWRKSTKTRPGSWVTWALQEKLASREANGTLKLIPHQGPLPPNPDDEILRLTALKKAA
ncbi:hypothetical protein [Sphingosinicella sp. BN140058]|uniref:hypothetical protein n=1 Tax=Sphingosinicella sp. BN140058 TaxID=1892855 RepID=UPI001011F8DE|nr:hypothetical protein [Sphingosinicella sp. BN140058]QAY80181.1 hypothetical protein ETR14_26420 [Sphingosinicella sp. BN140058]